MGRVFASQTKFTYNYSIKNKTPTNVGLDGVKILFENLILSTVWIEAPCIITYIYMLIHAKFFIITRNDFSVYFVFGIFIFK